MADEQSSSPSPNEGIANQVNPKTEVLASQALVSAIEGMSAFRHQDHFANLVSFMTSSLTATAQTREAYYTELASYRNTWLTNGIYDIIQNDVFVESGTADLISIKVDKDPKVEEELKNLFNKLNISNLVMSIFNDLLHNGSYYLRPIVKPGRGIVDFVDDLDAKSVISITDSKNNPLMFFVSNTINNRNNNTLSGTQVSNSYSQKTNYEYLDITQLIQFSLDLSFSRLALPEKVGKQIKSRTPNDAKTLLPSTLKVKTSQSFIWPAIDKLKETLLLDKLSVYRDIGSILTPNIVGVPVPDTYDPKQLIEIVKKYDEILNSNTVKLSNTQNMELTMQELAAVKVVPIVGDRSTPQSIDVGRSVPISSQEAMNDSLSRLLNSLGIPKELFDGQTDSKSNMKTNIRYAKKVKRIQKNICKTLNFLCLLHISHKFPSLTILADDIDIQLKSNTNIDELENMESQDLVVSSIASVKALLVDMEEIVAKSSYEIDVDEIITGVMESFSALGSRYHRAFKKKEVPTENTYTNSSDVSYKSNDQIATEAELDSLKNNETQSLFESVKTKLVKLTSK